MIQMSKAATFSKKSGNIDHNNRVEKKHRDNIDTERSKNNITIVQKPIEEFYQETFGAAIETYNDKARKSRQIKNYLKDVMEDKKKKPFYEIVLQIGDMNDTNCRDIKEEDFRSIEVQLMERYVKEFQRDYPNLKVFNAVIHLDEETPHLHLDYVPVATDLKRGMSVQNSQTKALEQIYAHREPKLKGLALSQEFMKEQRERISVLMKDFGIEQTPVGKSHGDLSVPQYKVAAKIGTDLAKEFL